MSLKVVVMLLSLFITPCFLSILLHFTKLNIVVKIVCPGRIWFLTIIFCITYDYFKSVILVVYNLPILLEEQKQSKAAKLIIY